jgi:hypothetical protein
MDDNEIAKALLEIADALRGLDKTMFEVFGNEKIGKALDQIAEGPDYAVSNSLDDVAEAIRGK